MLQDLETGRLENEFYNISATAEDVILCFYDGQVLLSEKEDGAPEFPTLADIQTMQDGGVTRYAFRINGKKYFLLMSFEPVTPAGNFLYQSVRQLRDLKYKEICFAAMTGLHLYNWYRCNKFCGNCGSKTVHAEQERMLRCETCGNTIYPRISPAVIVAITDGDRLLMSKYAGRGFTRYALIAGYTEIGETMEQTVRREVMEEVGLRVKNIRYYKSQPWGIDGNVLMGFYCDLDGDDTIHLDETELALAEWHHRGALPAKDDGLTLTREMIRIFDEGREPK